MKNVAVNATQVYFLLSYTFLLLSNIVFMKNKSVGKDYFWVGSGEDVENAEKFFEFFHQVEEINGKSYYIIGSHLSSLIVIIVICFAVSVLSLSCWM